jgi:hypothetical protein
VRRERTWDFNKAENHSTTAYNYYLHKETVEHQDSFFDLGWSENNFETFALRKTQSDIDAEGGNNLSVGMITFGLAPDIVNHKRNVYTYLDLLGDIGGLQGILISILSLLMSFLNLFMSNPLQTFLIERLFKT